MTTEDKQEEKKEGYVKMYPCPCGKVRSYKPADLICPACGLPTSIRTAVTVWHPIEGDERG